MIYHKDTVATFNPVEKSIAMSLFEFSKVSRNVGRTITIDNHDYTLEHVSRSTSSFFKSRGISIYYRTGRSVVRISDHWSRSNHNDRSRKFNCGSIGSCFWQVQNRVTDVFDGWGHGCGRFAHRLVAGRCGITAFN